MTEKHPYRRKSDQIRIKRRKKVQRSGFIGFMQLYFTHLRRYMMTGLLVWVPLIITCWVCWWVIYKLGFGLEKFVEKIVTNLNDLALDENGQMIDGRKWLTFITYRRGSGFLIAIAIFLTTGFFARYFAAMKLIQYGEQIVGMIPGINRVYEAVVQIRDVFVQREGAVFQETVLVEYPRPGLTVIGFVTSREQGVVQAELESELVAVFVPTTPNPTSGFLIYVSQDELTPLDISIEDAMKMIVSGGAYIPGDEEEDESAEDDTEEADSARDEVKAGGPGEKDGKQD